MTKDDHEHGIYACVQSSFGGGEWKSCEIWNSINKVLEKGFLDRKLVLGGDLKGRMLDHKVGSHNTQIPLLSLQGARWIFSFGINVI